MNTVCLLRRSDFFMRLSFSSLISMFQNVLPFLYFISFDVFNFLSLLVVYLLCLSEIWIYCCWKAL
jgi:hypothetical protein